MTDPVETLIIGGGISGLGCARRLCDAGAPFGLLTDRLGGRMYHSPDGRMNFGACYINADYRHIRRYVRRGLRFRLADAWCQTNGTPHTLLEWRNLRFVPGLLRLARRLHELRQVFRAFRRAAEKIAPCDLLPRFPLLQRYIRQPAGELIQELRLGQLHDDYLKPAFMSTCFVDPVQANALFYLGVNFPLVVPTWVGDFTHTYEQLTRGFRDRIVLDRVMGLTEQESGRWEVRTAAGRNYLARRVVLAVPYHNAREIYPVPQPPLATPATVLHVRGRRRPLFRGKRFVLFHPEQTGLALIWKQTAGHDLLYALRPTPDLSEAYEEVAVLQAVTWRTAIVLSGADWAPMRLRPTLFQVGDYNVCGLEDSFITGLCAANQILRDV